LDCCTCGGDNVFACECGGTHCREWECCTCGGACDCGNCNFCWCECRCACDSQSKYCDACLSLSGQTALSGQFIDEIVYFLQLPPRSGSASVSPPRPMCAPRTRICVNLS